MLTVKQEPVPSHVVKQSPLDLSNLSRFWRSSLDDNMHQSTRSKDDVAHVNEPSPTTNPHKSDFLNLLDPRVNRGGSKQMLSNES